MPTYDFEGGSIPAIIRVSNDNPWVISTTSPYAGTYCMEANASTADNEESQAHMIIDQTATGTMSFRYRTDSETNSDQLFFFIDGVVQAGFPKSGTSGAWTLFTSASLSTGIHIFQWIYAKDNNTSSGADRVYVDDIITQTLTDFSETIEGFESGIPAGYTNGSPAFQHVTTKSLIGTDCMASNSANGDGNTGEIEYTVTTAAGDMFFAHLISSERGYDYGRFYIDTVEQDEWSGDYGGDVDAEACGWIFTKYTVTAAEHTFKWEYAKDGGDLAGYDRLFIDQVYIPLPTGGGGATGKSNPLLGCFGGCLAGTIG